MYSVDENRIDGKEHVWNEVAAVRFCAICDFDSSRHGRISRRSSISNVVYLAVLTAYVFVLFRGPDLMTLRGLMFQVIAQKIIVYVSILNLAYQCFGVLAAENAQLRPGISQARNQNFERNS